jgi:nucleoside-diphosphate-sugar epimerase
MSATSNAKPVVAITGANGYLGRRCAEVFASAGWRVVALGRGGLGAADNVAFRLGDAVSLESLRGVKALVHCAYDFRLTGRVDIERVNVDGSARLLEAARAAGVEKVVFVSTISAFDGCKSMYGRAKLAIEKRAHRQGAFVIRPGLIFDDPPGGTFGRLVEQALNARFIPLIGDGSQVQYLVHNTDVASCIVRCCDADVSAPDRPVTIAHPQPWPLRELLQHIAARGHRTPTFVPVPWRLIWAALKTAEFLGLSLEFRSDSVVSLVNQNPSPDFDVANAFGVRCRPFV